ncbi:MAG: valine--tRNA ligase [Spirochaetes bacterium]|uniref:Valine--tRNA ligase n=1 Tax=Candidatus Gallitreponema excrementavium TaxID=2840840 RepID=A0A9D9N293_9SPIR|nr:valine--tRNA ligase [Candidatus Gallitreponema excrementavium]
MKAIELEKAYNPKSFEDRVYKDWEESGSFKPLSDKNPLEAAGRPNFTVVIPPPNVTGVLHMGHGLNNTLQDIVVRYHRMKGDNTLWLPGTDHAGIATQNVVERRLKKEGLRRQDLGRDKFLEKTWEVKREHHSIISNQQRRLGNSVDWSRERFTLDEGLSKAVREVFVTLYERNLIYRGNYLVNWCPSCGTALADDEVEHEDTAGAMYHMYYEIADGSSIPAVTLEDGTVFPGGNRIEIATTRPETLFGDTAVAVHPDDPRYKALVGKKVRLALTDREIPVVADSYVDRAFGTGVVKITPAHDPNDWEVGKRCGLDILNILNPDGTLNENVPEKYRGLSCKEARKTVVEDLISAGLFKEEEKITHSVGHCYRCHSVVEPYLSTQWFVRMKPMAEKALKAWKEGKIVFYPKKWENTYSHWMENIRDWCISRQLWWGHRIPVWYCQECGKMIVSREDPQNCPDCKAGKDKLQQDPDVLDTWFSSWLWPFSTLGWPEDTADLKTFYPTTALVTAYDIIFFWVSRMIMAGLEFTGKVPFRDINMHGLVRDKQGRKMSKSLGNGLDPLEIIDEYGADALKYTLAFMCAQGQDVLIDKDSFKLGSRFANKIWNASRYILGNLEGRELRAVSRTELKELDLWIINRLNLAAKNTASALESYRYNDAAQTVYEYFWNDFCDWYVEATKLSFKNGDEAEKDRAVSVLLNVLEESLRLLHPLLPFVTEEIYRFLPENCVTGGKKKADKLITAPYPLFSEERVDTCSEERFTSLQEIVRLVRALRTECGIDPAFKIKVALFVEKGSPAEAAKEKTDIICLLAGLSGVDFLENPKDKAKGSIGTVGKGFEAFIVPGEGADPEKMVQKFKKELEKEEGNFSKLKGKLSNEKFVANAPAEVVEGEKEKLNEIQRRIEKLKAYVSELV